MKKIVSLILIICLTFACMLTVVACDDNSGAPASDGQQTPAQPGDTDDLSNPDGSDDPDNTDGNDEEFDFSAHEQLYNSVLSSQETYLKSLQLDNGAFTKWSPNASGVNDVVPYFACFVGFALLENPDNAGIVRDYIDWHFSALNDMPDYNTLLYTIYDHELKNGEVTVKIGADSHGTYDSTDSYAALFLMLLDKYVTVSEDTAVLSSRVAEIDGIVAVMNATYSNGLTYAKPDYSIQYLMDNSEVYAGYTSAASLYTLLGETDKSTAASVKAASVKNAIGDLYSSTRGLYQPYKNKLASTTTFYPDMAAQLYPSIFGACVDKTVNDKVYSKFNGLISSAADLDEKADFPWIIVAYGAYINGDYALATDILSTSYTDHMSGNAYPWYSMEGAMAYLTASKLKAEIK